MNKKITIVLVLVAVAVIAGAFLFLRGDEDTWLCQNGQWVEHGNPAGLQPREACLNENLELDSPTANQLIQSPLALAGQAKTWYFEGSFPIKLVDENGQMIAQSYVSSQGDWMTDQFVPFVGSIEFFVATTTRATLILQKDNPSDMREFDEFSSIPLTLQASETMKVKVFFNNSNLDPEFSCNKVFPVEREVAKTEAVARVALEELLKGATEQEKADGFFSNINSGVKIQSLTIENGVAKVDFDEQLQYQVGGSCRVSAIRAEITETLKQFPTVDDVVISINGQIEDILQP